MFARGCHNGGEKTLPMLLFYVLDISPTICQSIQLLQCLLFTACCITNTPVITPFMPVFCHLRRVYCVRHKPILLNAAQTFKF